MNSNMPIDKQNQAEDTMGREMDTFTACSIVEGFDGEEHTKEEQIEAWQYLIDTGAVWKLQGWYGRAAIQLLEDGICHKDYLGNNPQERK